MPDIERRGVKRERDKTPYLFYNPEQLITPEMKEWISHSTIVHIPPLWLPLPRDGRRYGGVEDVVFNIAKSLDSHGVKKQIIFGHPGNLTLKDTIDADVHMADVECSNDPESLLRLLRTDPKRAFYMEKEYIEQAYNKILKDDSITIVHDHTNLGRKKGQEAATAHKPVIRTEHGPLTYPDAPKSEEEILRSFENMSGMGFVAISRDQMNQIPNLNWMGVNYNGVDVRDFEYREDKSDYLLYLGRIARDKGTHNAAIVARELGMKLIIAGSVEETFASLKYYNEEVQPLIDGKNIVHLANGVDAAERKKLLSHANALLVLNEWREPFGMVMPEAMASGTPVVGFRKGSIPEIVKGRTGFVVDTLEEAKEAVIKLSKGDFSPEECRKRVEKYFSSEAMVARYIKTYMKQEKSITRESD